MKRSVAGRRPLLLISDVAATSLTSLALGIYAARTLTVDGFAFVAIVLTTVGLLQTILQGGFADVVLQSRLGRTRLGDGLEVGIPIIAIGLLLGALGVFGSRASYLALLVAGATFLLLRQTWVRAEMVSVGANMASTAVSMLTLATSAVAVMSIETNIPEIRVGQVFVLTYLLPASASFLLRRRLGIASIKPAWRTRYAAEAFVLGGASQMATLIAMATFAATFSAGQRGASMLLGPAAVLFTLARLWIIPQASSARPSVLIFMRVSSVLALCTAGTVLVAYFALWFAPSILGSSTTATSELLPWVAGMYVAQGLYIGAFSCFRAWKLDRQVTRARTVQVLLLALGGPASLAAQQPTAFLTVMLLQFAVPFVYLANAVRRSEGRQRA